MKIESAILYHGSYQIVEKPELAQCRKGKDFGQGFYLTTDKKQAERFTKTSVRKAVQNGTLSSQTKEGFISMFKVKSLSGLKVFEFKDADKEWLHCVVGHRRFGSLKGEVEKWSGFDIICGKIANDDTNLVITAYIDGAYGEIGSERADEIAIGFLEPNNLKNQLCFRTEKAINVLEYAGYESVAL
jgi:hypothetical protein